MAVFVLVGEATVRFFELGRYGVPFFPKSDAEPKIILDDAVLGWRINPDYSFERPSPWNAAGISFQKDGFRVYGDPASARRKMLVIGDSGTSAAEVPDGRTYYSLLGKDLGWEVFAFGMAGYGTLQESIVLDRSIDEIRPDVVLWQFSSTDFRDNYAPLDTDSAIFGMSRPYWEDGKVKFGPAQSATAGRMLIRSAVSRSRLLAFIVGCWARWRASGREKDVSSLGWEHEGFKSAYAVTDELMRRVKGRVGDIPTLAFQVGGTEFYEEAFRKIASRNGIVFIDDVGRGIEQARKDGRDVFAGGGNPHWNETGHRLAAEKIAARLRRLPLKRRR